MDATSLNKCSGVHLYVFVYVRLYYNNIVVAFVSFSLSICFLESLLGDYLISYFLPEIEIVMLVVFYIVLIVFLLYISELYLHKFGAHLEYSCIFTYLYI